MSEEKQTTPTPETEQPQSTPEKTKKQAAPLNFADMNTDDWRGILAVIIMIGGFALIFVAMFMDKTELIAAFIGLIMVVGGWYFDSKKSNTQ